MADTRPNHFISIPRSVLSLKHYFDVHDQPLSRSLLYLALIGAIVTVLTTAVAYVHRQSLHEPMLADLTENVSSVRFQDGKAVVEGDTPRVLWAKTLDVPTPPIEEGGEPGTATIRTFIIVADMTGTLDTLGKAEEFARCVVPKAFLYFGADKIEHFAEDENQQGKLEQYEYLDDEKLKELTELAGEGMPEVTVEDGKATFALEPGKLHVVVHRADLMVFVDTTGISRGLKEAGRDPLIRELLDRPEFFVLLKPTELLVRSAHSAAPSGLVFKDAPPADGAALAEQLASLVTRSRTSTALRDFVPQFLDATLVLFVIALVAAVVGVLASGIVRAGITYTEALNMALYAITPATVGVLLIALVPNQANALILRLVAAVGIAAAYTVLGVRRVALGLQPDDAPTI